MPHSEQGGAGAANATTWATVAAALPQAERARRERPFWQAAVSTWGWRRVVDAGCGNCFHLLLLRELGVDGVGFDAELATLAPRHLKDVLAGDLTRPPLRGGEFDAALCLGNTFSLLATRPLQRAALVALSSLVRPGGMVLLQGEDVGLLAASGPMVRTRTIDAETFHLRVFERFSRRVRMLAGVVHRGAEVQLQETWLQPTSATDVVRLAEVLRLASTPLPAPAPGGGASWWTALSVPANESSGSGRRRRKR